VSGPARAVLLDRDGVLNELVEDPVSGLPESPLRVADVRLLAGAAAAVARLAAAGWALACVSNQPAAAKGRVSVEQLLAVHRRVLELLAQEGAELTVWRLCLHHPAGVVAGLAGECGCRKPAPGMLLQASAALGVAPGACWMVGDTDADVGAGRAAGAHTALVGYPGSAHKRSGELRADLYAEDLAAAVSAILGFRPRAVEVGDRHGAYGCLGDTANMP
jgi:D-glycero-D-manno-heptose 1,7-bisphosphate phosphatase